MVFTLYTYLINCIYLIKSPLKTSKKGVIFLTYTLYTCLGIIPYIPKPKSIKIFSFKINGFRFDLLHYLFGEIFVKNEYYFVSNKKKPAILDCGSNIGMSVVYFKYLYPDAIIYAFEPDPQTFSMLKRNIEQNNIKGVHLFNKALSDREEVVTFYTAKEPGNLMMSTIKGRMSEVSIEVKSISLGDFLNKKLIDFMKMDIEGGEGRVLVDIIKKNKLINIHEFIVEYHHNIENNSLSLSDFLAKIEERFDYQLETTLIPIYSKYKFQDILIFAYQKHT